MCSSKEDVCLVLREASASSSFTGCLFCCCHDKMPRPKSTHRRKSCLRQLVVPGWSPSRPGPRSTERQARWQEPEAEGLNPRPQAGSRRNEQEMRKNDGCPFFKRENSANGLCERQGSVKMQTEAEAVLPQVKEHPRCAAQREVALSSLEELAS